MSSRQKLPYLDLVNFKGLYTKSSPELVKNEMLRIAENCDFFETYGALSKIRGNAKVLASQYTEASVVKSIPWISFYKTPSLTGAVDRQVLFAAGTTLRKINGSSSTLLMSNRTPNLFHHSTQLGAFMFITNQDTDNVGVGDTNLKYDGAVMTYWGITAPGSQEYLIEAFDDKTEWTTTNANVFDETTVTLEGGNALRIDKAGITDRIFSVEKAFDFYVTKDERDTSQSAGSRVNFSTFIPRGGLTDDFLSTDSFDPYEAAMVVWVSPNPGAVLPTFWKFYFQIGDLVEGWNKLSLNFSDRPVGNFYPDAPPKLIRRTKFDFRLEDKLNTKQNIRLDKFVQLDEGTPILSQFG